MSNFLPESNVLLYSCYNFNMRVVNANIQMEELNLKQGDMLDYTASNGSILFTLVKVVFMPKNQSYAAMGRGRRAETRQNKAGFSFSVAVSFHCS